MVVDATANPLPGRRGTKPARGRKCDAKVRFIVRREIEIAVRSTPVVNPLEEPLHTMLLPREEHVRAEGESIAPDIVEPQPLSRTLDQCGLFGAVNGRRPRIDFRKQFL